MSDKSRIYTNVILTIIAILLLILAVKPQEAFLSVSQAQQDEPRKNIIDTYLEAAGKIATSTDRVADANTSIAKAIQDLSESVRGVGSQISTLASTPRETK